MFTAVQIKLIWNALCLTNINLISLHTYKMIDITHNFSLKTINERDSDPLESGSKTGLVGDTQINCLKQLILHYRSGST